MKVRWKEMRRIISGFEHCFYNYKFFSIQLFKWFDTRINTRCPEEN